MALRAALLADATALVSTSAAQDAPLPRVQRAVRANALLCALPPTLSAREAAALTKATKAWTTQVYKLIHSRGPHERALGAALAQLTVEEGGVPLVCSAVLSWLEPLAGMLKSDAPDSRTFRAATRALAASFRRFATLIELPRVRKEVSAAAGKSFLASLVVLEHTDHPACRQLCRHLLLIAPGSTRAHIAKANPILRARLWAAVHQGDPHAVVHYAELVWATVTASDLATSAAPGAEWSRHAGALLKEAHAVLDALSGASDEHCVPRQLAMRLLGRFRADEVGPWTGQRPETTDAGRLLQHMAFLLALLEAMLRSATTLPVPVPVPALSLLAWRLVGLSLEPGPSDPTALGGLPGVAVATLGILRRAWDVAGKAGYPHLTHVLRMATDTLRASAAGLGLSRRGSGGVSSSSLVRSRTGTGTSSTSTSTSTIPVYPQGYHQAPHPSVRGALYRLVTTLVRVCGGGTPAALAHWGVLAAVAELQPGDDRPRGGGTGGVGTGGVVPEGPGDAGAGVGVAGPAASSGVDKGGGVVTRLRQKRRHWRRWVRSGRAGRWTSKSTRCVCSRSWCGSWVRVSRPRIAWRWMTSWLTSPRRP